MLVKGTHFPKLQVPSPRNHRKWLESLRRISTTHSSIMWQINPDKELERPFENLVVKVNVNAIANAFTCVNYSHLNVGPGTFVLPSECVRNWEVQLTGPEPDNGFRSTYLHRFKGSRKRPGEERTGRNGVTFMLTLKVINNDIYSFRPSALKEIR